MIGTLVFILAAACALVGYGLAGQHWLGALLGLIAPFALWHGVAWAARNGIGWLANQGRKQKASAAIPRPAGFALWAGQSTGVFASRGHARGVRAPGVDLWLGLEDACQNILVLGGIGSGKTTRIVQPMLDQLLAQNAGGLIVDVKGDFGRAAAELAGRHGKQLTVIGVGQTPLNLLKGLTPEMASSFLKSAFFLSGSHSDPFWVDSATELCKSGLGVLSFVPGQYSLSALHDFLWDSEARERAVADALRYAVTDRDQRLLKVYRNYYDVIFGGYDPKVQQSILATVAQVLSPFQHPDLTDYFCTDRPDAANMEDALTGTVFLIDLPLATWGMGAKTVYTLIKLRLFNVLQSRQARPELDQTTPVFFVADEYQNLISANKSGLSDLNFWDKSRSAKCIGIISAQSVSAFRAAIGDTVLADTVLANFRQKFVFRSEDEATLRYCNELAGRAEVERQSVSTGHSSSTMWTSGNHDSQSDGVTTTLQERAVVDSQLIRQLGPNGALAFLSIGGRAVDDAVQLRPLFLQS